MGYISSLYTNKLNLGIKNVNDNHKFLTQQMKLIYEISSMQQSTIIYHNAQKSYAKLNGIKEIIQVPSFRQSRKRKPRSTTFLKRPKTPNTKLQTIKKENKKN